MKSFDMTLNEAREVLATPELRYSEEWEFAEYLVELAEWDAAAAALETN